MRRFSMLIGMLVIAVCLSAITIPRVVAQKLVLTNGKNPDITVVRKSSAPEYTLRAYILGREKEVLSTETDPYYSISVKRVGDGRQYPYTVVAYVQLGNFHTQWQAGENLHLEITHKSSKEKKSWDIYIPDGTKVINKIKDPVVIPPKVKK